MYFAVFSSAMESSGFRCMCSNHSLISSCLASRAFSASLMLLLSACKMSVVAQVFARVGDLARLRLRDRYHHRDDGEDGQDQVHEEREERRLAYRQVVLPTQVADGALEPLDGSPRAYGREHRRRYRHPKRRPQRAGHLVRSEEHTS